MRISTLLSGLALIFSIQAFAQNNITITIETDCWGGEISWGLFNSNNNQLAGVGPNTLGNNQTFNTPVNLPNGCYEFRINDSFGDGLNGQAYGCAINGDYYITDAQNNILAQMTAPNGDFDFGVIHAFCVPFIQVLGCTDPAANNYDPAANTDDGSCFGDPLVADFSYDLNGGCSGTTVDFNDLSSGYVDANSWAWTFDGGNPASSNIQNPSVTYANAGVYNASLIVSNALGEMAVMTHQITIGEGNILDIQLIADNYPNEISWLLTDPYGVTVASGGSTGTTLCIGEGCYIFTINDSYGDGICCGYGIGSYTLVLNGEEIATGGNYAYTESQYVNCPDGIDCNNTIGAQEGINTAPIGDDWFTYTPAENGQYRISTCGFTNCNSTIWMYDYCNMLNFDDTNEATLTYNDDACGSQAELTPYLEGGQEYYIRVGSIDGSCDGNPMDFEISYMGGIPGCMNPAACNYLPIASEPTECFFIGDPECPEFGPDLFVLGDVFYNSMYFTTLENQDACYVNEGCMQGFGNREIIRFTTHIKNIGTEDYFIGAPNNQPGQFEWDVCHNHWHYEGYAEYVLYDGDGNEMPQIGFKNGFCVLDLECSDGGIAKYTCGNMGVTAGCGDIYSSGLSCQWVDVTDVPAGDYTLVIRTNWDFAADANGSYELRYDNNWAAVCVSFDRDANNQITNFSKTLNCPIVLDCVGVPFGNAQPDCAANCPGIIVRGDLNASNDLEYADADQYLSEILGNDAVVTDCTDMNNDGSITVTDAALVAGCVFFGTDYVDEYGVHNHCIFNDEIMNPNHNVTLSIAEVNTDAGYVDVHILNPDNEVVAYEFTVSGFTISSVQNIYDPLLFDVVPAASLGGTRVLGYCDDDQFLPKNYSPAPFIRIYYLNNAGPEACIASIVDFVNEDYHEVVTTIGGCLPFVMNTLTDFSAHDTDICVGDQVNYSDLSTHNPSSWEWSFPGGSPAFSNDQNPSVVYNNSGVYAVTLTAGNGVDSDSETKVDYIVVSTPTLTFYEDADGDGFGNALASILACAQDLGFVSNADDCDDSRNDVYPEAPGTAQDVDNDCNGIVEDDEVALCLGDLNNDNLINVSDLLLLLSEIGCITECLYDLTGDGVVNTADQLIFLASYGTMCD